MKIITRNELFKMINSIETTMYEDKTDFELFAWVKVNFIPISELIKN
jgi:hypothetical protein